MAEGTSTLFLLLRMALSLGVVLGGVALAVRVMRRRGLDRAPARGGRADRLVVLDRRSLTKGAHVALVRLGDQDLLLGVTDRRVDVLGRCGPVPEGTGQFGAPEGDDVVPRHGDPIVAVPPAAPAGSLPPATPDGVIDVTGHLPSFLAAPGTSTGTRRTGSPIPAAPAAGAESRMGFVEALRELTVRRS